MLLLFVGLSLFLWHSIVLLDYLLQRTVPLQLFNFLLKLLPSSHDSDGVALGRLLHDLLLEGQRHSSHWLIIYFLEGLLSLENSVTGIIDFLLKIRDRLFVLLQLQTSDGRLVARLDLDEVSVFPSDRIALKQVLRLLIKASH